LGDPNVEYLPRLLGLLSLGLGAASLAVPDRLSAFAGVDDAHADRTMMRIMGARELGHAAGLLAGRRPAGWAWTRVAGDALDLTALSLAMSARDGERRRRAAIATGIVGAITMLDLFAALRSTRFAQARNRAMRLHASITVNRPSDEVYRFWHDFGNLPRFMSHLESVRIGGDGRSRWMAKGPAGQTVRWDAEIIEDRPHDVIAWRSMPGTMVPNAGRVRFLAVPGGRGTEVRVELAYAPPAGALGRVVAKLFGEEPAQQVKDDLRRFKQVIETGEIVRSDGSPQGTNVRQQMMQRPAQPPAVTPAK
jgi:uncharacterized membrane protein